jgi:hypothetical protein
MLSTWKAKASDGLLSRVLSRRRERSDGASARTFAGVPVVPHWLSVLHRLVTLVVLLAICVATVALVATLVHIGHRCYERTVHTAHGLSTSATSIHATLGERP